MNKKAFAGMSIAEVYASIAIIVVLIGFTMVFSVINTTKFSSGRSEIQSNVKEIQEQEILLNYLSKEVIYHDQKVTIADLISMHATINKEDFLKRGEIRTKINEESIKYFGEIKNVAWELRTISWVTKHRENSRLKTTDPDPVTSGETEIDRDAGSLVRTSRSFCALMPGLDKKPVKVELILRNLLGGTESRSEYDHLRSNLRGFNC